MVYKKEKMFDITGLNDRFLYVIRTIICRQIVMLGYKQFTDWLIQNVNKSRMVYWFVMYDLSAVGIKLCFSKQYGNITVWGLIFYFCFLWGLPILSYVFFNMFILIKCVLYKVVQRVMSPMATPTLSTHCQSREVTYSNPSGSFGGSLLIAYDQ